MTSVLPASTFSLKLPSKSVTVPFDVPFSITVAPMTGPIASVTVPVISCCAYIIVLSISVRKLRKNLFACFICFFIKVSTLFEISGAKVRLIRLLGVKLSFIQCYICFNVTFLIAFERLFLSSLAVVFFMLQRYDNPPKLLLHKFRGI